jgi:hypothetical protein
MNTQIRTELNKVHYVLARAETDIEEIREVILSFRDVVEELVKKVNSLESVAHVHKTLE